MVARVPGTARGDDGAAALVGVILIVAVTVTSAAAAFVYFTSFSEDSRAAPAIAFHATADECTGRIMVAHSEGAFWHDMTIKVSGASRYGVTAAGFTAENSDWSGSALTSSVLVKGGDIVRIGVGESVSRLVVTFVHEPSRAVVWQKEIVPPPPDTLPPAAAASVAEGATVQSLTSVSGVAGDNCFPAQVKLSVQRLSDGSYLGQSGFQAQAHYFRGSGREWQVALDEAATGAPAGQYRIVTIPVDAAGNNGPASTVNITYSPPGTPTTWAAVLKLRVAGTPANTITMELREDGVAIQTVQIVRQAGNPNEQAVYLNATLTQGRSYVAHITCTCTDNGSNPSWLEYTIDGATTTENHNFNKQQQSTHVWDVSLQLPA